MQTDRLEDFVRANKDEFDFREPSANVWEQINKEAKPTKVVSLRQYMLRIAAVVAVVAVSSVLLLQLGVGSSSQLANNADPELLELMEAEAFYSHQVDKKLKEKKIEI